MRAPRTTYNDEIFRPVRTKRAFEEISTEIKRLIFAGALKPGDRLPGENELARKYNVSRQTIREALRVLELTGVIKMRKGGIGGPLVVDTMLHAINNLYLDAVQMKSISKEEIEIARIKIEKAILDEAINRADHEDIQKLEDNLALEKMIYAKNLDAFEKNAEFHRLVAKASKNGLFVIVMESLIAVVADFRSRIGLDLEVSGRAIKEHEEIVKAIKMREHKRASALMEKHLTYVSEVLEEQPARKRRGKKSGRKS
ncbi:MAG TPA: FCD domain-containing protein [Syntrophorhabdales bacterium]|nr:FCD domain-containing protein [Syntrophorhabdales bacterium]